MAFQIGSFYYYLKSVLKKKSLDNIYIVKHEELCLDPIKEFKQLYKKLELNWNTRVENKIKNYNKKGSGFKINRIAIKQIEKYKRLLSIKQIKEIEEYYSIFDKNYYNEF